MISSRSRSGLWPELALALALAGPATSCRKGAPASAPPGPAAMPPQPAPRLGAVVVRAASAATWGLNEEALAAAARTQLDSAGLFALGDAGASATAGVLIQLAPDTVEEAGKGAVQVAAHLLIQVRPSRAADPHWAEDVRAGAERVFDGRKISRRDRAALVSQVADRLCRDLLEGYIARQKLHTGDEGLLLAALEADHGELRDEALRIVGDRHTTAAVPTLLRLLDDEDERIRDGALGALVQLRERKAIKALIDSRSLRDGREMRKIFDAIVALGGEEAEQYLSFVADGHDDEAVRAEARAALAKLKKKTAASGGPPSR